MKLIIPLFLISIIISCQPATVPVDLEKERTLLLQSDDIQRTAHLKGDANMLANEVADTIWSVQFGDINASSRSDLAERFGAYFPNVKYEKWDNLETPLINISKDGSLATVSVKKIVIAASKTEEGNWTAADTTIFAWTAAYKKEAGNWKIYSTTSTRRMEDLQK